MSEAVVTGRPIGDYALLSDCQSAALVSGAGSVDWLCMPRFDSPSVFGRLLDADAGHWVVSPSGEFEVRRSYLAGSLVLATQFTTPHGAAMLTDALVFDHKARGHDIGESVPHVLVRVVEVLDGEVPIDIEFSPRFEYGLVRPSMRPVDGGVLCMGGATVLLLAGDAPTTTHDGIASWRLALNAGESLAFALQFGRGAEGELKAWSGKEIVARLADTVAGWQSWSELHQGYQGPWRDQVQHGGRVLQGLTYQPTGAVVAAPTTSLPETPGGERNWDYRYTWVRDSSMTAHALWVAACPDEAEHFFKFLRDAAGDEVRSASGMSVVFGIGGEHDLSERELSHLSGWRGSRPVRVGNDAWRQSQNDVYGSLLDAAYRLRERLTGLDPETKSFLCRVADTAEKLWREPDNGIWEMRGEPRHFVHSKLMCWVALDRAVKLAELLDATDRISDWAAAAEQVRQSILENGWNDDLGAFSQSFGSNTLDASVLMLAITGCVPATDLRMRSTIERIAIELAAPCGLLYRYNGDDGLAGSESTFLLCSYWLAECWALVGELPKAKELFERASAYANDVGLLSEEADPLTGELLGNFPQAFSHIGLINAAWAISRAEQPE